MMNADSPLQSSKGTWVYLVPFLKAGNFNIHAFLRNGGVVSGKTEILGRFRGVERRLP